VGKRLLREFQREVRRLASEEGGLLLPEGGTGPVRAVTSKVQRGQTRQLARLPAAGDRTGHDAACGAGRTNMITGTAPGAGHHSGLNR